MTADQGSFDFGSGLTPRAQAEFQAGQAAKTAGMEVAAANRENSLQEARRIARSIALAGDGTCDADQVGAELRRLGRSQLGPAAGSLFKSACWEFTGRRVLSRKTSNHARELKVWRYQGR